MDPKVSIGLPVFNGEDYLAKAIESVLQQTFTDLELVISDNGSSDTTEAICHFYAEKDSRVRYYRNKENRGASWNYNRVVDLSRGKYFRWHAHDDKLEPTTIEKSVAVLDSCPDVVLCFTWTRDIDHEDNQISIKQSTRNFDDVRPYARFASLGRVNPIHNCEEVFGLMRIEILRQTPMIASYTDSDRTLIAQLSLYGPFFQIDEPLFVHRMHAKSSVRVNPNEMKRMAWFDPTLSGHFSTPRWRQFRELNRAIAGAPIALQDKIRCRLEMIRWAKRQRRQLLEELQGSIKYRFNRNLPKFEKTVGKKGNPISD